MRIHPVWRIGGIGAALAFLVMGCVPWYGPGDNCPDGRCHTMSQPKGPESCKGDQSCGIDLRGLLRNRGGASRVPAAPGKRSPLDAFLESVGDYIRGEEHATERQVRTGAGCGASSNYAWEYRFVDVEEPEIVMKKRVRKVPYTTYETVKREIECETVREVQKDVQEWDYVWGYKKKPITVCCPMWIEEEYTDYERMTKIVEMPSTKTVKTLGVVGVEPEKTRPATCSERECGAVACGHDTRIQTAPAKRRWGEIEIEVPCTVKREEAVLVPVKKKRKVKRNALCPGFQYIREVQRKPVTRKKIVCEPVTVKQIVDQQVPVTKWQEVVEWVPETEFRTSTKIVGRPVPVPAKPVTPCPPPPEPACTPVMPHEPAAPACPMACESGCPTCRTPR